jgi:TP901 family phage tail tape measure protein/lambda family phage tail tape measure protein
MAADGTIFIEIDPTGAVVGAKRVERSLDRVGTSAERAGKKVSRSRKAFSDISRSLIGPLGMAAAALAVVRGLKSVIDVSTVFQKSISELSAITGATGKDLAFLSDQAKLLGRTTTLSASQVAIGFKLIASAKPDLLESGEALTEVTKQAITLAEAAGITLPEAATALAGSLNQFQADADQAARFINVLAAGSKRGAAEIPDLTASLKAAGTVAASANISFEETVATIETLALVNLKAEESGTALRNIILLLQKQGIDKLDPSVVGLTNALENLNEEELSNTEILKKFGVRNFAAVKALTLRIDSTRELQIAITGTLTAEQQALINTDNLDGKTKALSSAIEGLSIALGDSLLPNLEDSTGFLADYINVMTDSIEATNEFGRSVARAFGAEVEGNAAILQRLAKGNVAAVDEEIEAQERLVAAIIKTGGVNAAFAQLPFDFGLGAAFGKGTIRDAEVQLAKLKFLKDELVREEIKNRPQTAEDKAIEAEIAAAKKFADEQIAILDAREKAQKLAAKNAKRLAEEQQRSFKSLAASLQPLEGSLTELNEAEAVLQQQRALGLITADEQKVLQGQLTDAFRDALDPIGALNQKLEEEQTLAKLSNAERAIEARVIQEVNSLKKAGVEDADSQADAIRKSVRATSALIEVQRASKTVQKVVNEELELQKLILEEIKGPQEDMEDRLVALKVLLDDDAISLDEFNQQLSNLRKQTLEGQTGVEAGFERGFIKAQENLNDFASLSEKIVTDSFQGMEDAAVNFAKTGKLEIGSLVDSILADFVRLQVRQSFAGALGSSDGKGGGSGLLGLVAGLFSSSTAGSGSAGADAGGPPGVSDGLFASLASSLASNQEGGIERTPTISTLAEKGPEAVIPLKGGKVPVDIKEPSKPPININNVFNISTPDVGSFGRSTGQVGLMMGQAFQSAIGRNG